MVDKLKLEPRWWNGRHAGLKNLSSLKRRCRFKSDPRHIRLVSFAEGEVAAKPRQNWWVEASVACFYFVIKARESSNLSLATNLVFAFSFLLDFVEANAVAAEKKIYFSQRAVAVFGNKKLS